jgi:LPXTG-motif cell wall-anchored protein
MKKVIVLTKFFILNILCWPLMAMSQDSIVFEDDPAVFDSTLLEQEFVFGEVAKSSGSNNSLIIIVAVLVVISAAIYFILKKRKK